MNITGKSGDIFFNPARVSPGRGIVVSFFNFTFNMGQQY
jgi:hypothetical protein